MALNRKIKEKMFEIDLCAVNLFDLEEELRRIMNESKTRPVHKLEGVQSTQELRINQVKGDMKNFHEALKDFLRQFSEMIMIETVTFEDLFELRRDPNLHIRRAAIREYVRRKAPIKKEEVQ